MITASHKLAALLCCLLAVSSAMATAQQTVSPQAENKTSATKQKTQLPRKINCNPQGRMKDSSVNVIPNQQKAPAEIAPPVNRVGKTAESEFLAGQVEVSVKGNQDPIIKLGLARNGSTVVEFPALDNFFAVHPGSSNVVTVDESPTLATDHYLVFRAGRDFAPPLAGSQRRTDASNGVAAVSVQMQSGMFVTLMFYPVRSVEKMAHRCVVIYSRDEVIAARRAAGLTVNSDAQDAQAADTLVTSKRVAAMLPTTAATPKNADAEGDRTMPLKPESSNSTIVETGSAPSPLQKEGKHGSIDFVTEAKSALRSALAAPSKFTGWSKPLHGLSISLSSPLETDTRHQLITVAVRNSTAKGLRLVAGEPSLDVVTLDGKDQPVLVQSLVKHYVETTSPGGAIPAGATIYFAVVYEPPTLGINQQMRVSVANTGAADEPAVAVLPK